MKKMKTNKQQNEKVLQVIADNYKQLLNKYVLNNKSNSNNNFDGETTEDVFHNTIVDMIEHSAPATTEEILKLFELRYNVINYRTIMSCKHHTRIDDILNNELNNEEDADNL